MRAAADNPGELEVVFNGKTRGHLRTAFNRVRNPQGWKLPINRIVVARGEDELEDILDAIDFFVGGGGEVKRIRGRTFRVTAPGYYVTIGA